MWIDFATIATKERNGSLKLHLSALLSDMYLCISVIRVWTMESVLQVGGVGGVVCN